MVCQIAGDVFDVIRILGFEGLQRFGAAGEDDHIIGGIGVEEVF